MFKTMAGPNNERVVLIACDHCKQSIERLGQAVVMYPNRDWKVSVKTIHKGICQTQYAASSRERNTVEVSEIELTAFVDALHGFPH